MIEITIVQMKAEHIASVAEIEKESFSTPWSEQGVKEELGNPYARFFVAIINGKIVGYIGAHNILGEVYITNVAVSPLFRGRNIGKSLIEYLKKISKTESAEFVTLEVRKSNFIAISLYEKCGFSVVGERKSFYENPKEDAVLMTFYFD